MKFEQQFGCAAGQSLAVTHTCELGKHLSAGKQREGKSPLALTVSSEQQAVPAAQSAGPSHSAP